MTANPTDLCDAWCRWLRTQEWQYAVTLTFDPDRHRPSFSAVPTWCDKAFRSLVQHVNEQLYGKRWISKTEHKGIVWARVYEAHQNGNLHFHALIRMPNRTPSIELAKSSCNWWDARYGHAGFEVPRSQDAVIRYLIKGMRSTNNSSVDISYNFPPVR